MLASNCVDVRFMDIIIYEHKFLESTEALLGLLYCMLIAHFRIPNFYFIDPAVDVK